MMDGYSRHFALTFISCCGRYNIILTSVSGWRETHRAEKSDVYFDFKQFKLCEQLDISYGSK